VYGDLAVSSLDSFGCICIRQTSLNLTARLKRVKVKSFGQACRNVRELGGGTGGGGGGGGVICLDLSCSSCCFFF